MDTNGQRFWMLADESDWNISNPDELEYESSSRRLKLSNKRLTPFEQERNAIELALAEAHLQKVPATLDLENTLAYWDEGDKAVVIEVNDQKEKIYVPSSVTAPTDICLGFDGVLYLAIDGKIFMHDQKWRWSTVVLEEESFVAWRLAAMPDGGVWVLDKVNKRLAKVQGMPLTTVPGPYADDIFRPCEENPNPPRLIVLDKIDFDIHEQPVAISANATGVLIILCWNETGPASVRKLIRNQFESRNVLEELVYPYSIDWIKADRFAVLLANTNEALVYQDNTSLDQLPAVGDFYPLRDHDATPFIHHLNEIPHYTAVRMEDGVASILVKKLSQISLPTYSRLGSAENRKVIDSGDSHTEWHRLYIEAIIPKQCFIEVSLSASDDTVIPEDESNWYPHYFGKSQRNENAEIRNHELAPEGVWQSYPSELPHHEGLLDCERVNGQSGLFTVLVQRSGLRVRSLTGRYLWLRITLHGNGRQTPELIALRTYGSRFSYVDHYFPEFYRENVFAPDADAVGKATPADFLERSLLNFESLLTPLQDRIENAHLLTQPQSIPDEALDWLASWVGLTVDSAMPVERKRLFIEIAARLYRWHGTLKGLKAAIEVASGGELSAGNIVVLEDYRLRRTAATILGADLTIENDPLLIGTIESGNSYVGDTLFLGDELKKEFLALFNIEDGLSEDENQAIELLYDRLAFRTTILVHHDIEPQELGLLKRVVEMETPAHVEAKVVKATRPFLVGMASLVGVDTYLDKARTKNPVRIDKSIIGISDFIKTPAKFNSPYKLSNLYGESGSGKNPIAKISASDAEYGYSFNLDSHGSRAFGGRNIARRIWEYLQ